MPTTGKPKNSSSASRRMQSSGSVTTARFTAGLSPAHAERLKQRGLDPELCERLGFRSVGAALAFDYFRAGELHDTKLRRGKGNMPWAEKAGLILWNIDSLAGEADPDEAVIFTEGEIDGATFVQAGFTRVVSLPNGAQTGENGFQFLYRGDELIPELRKFKRYVIATDGDTKGRACRDALAVRLGDTKCDYVVYPKGTKDANEVLQDFGPAAVAALVDDAKPMWMDELVSLSGVPEAPEQTRYRFGITALDNHGLRLTLPCFMPIIGPYGSGKSVMIRQLLAHFYDAYGWRSMLTAFEEQIRPRFERSFRLHYIGKPWREWTDEDTEKADQKIDDGHLFLRRAKGKPLDTERVLDRIEYAAQRYGIRVAAIDPVNEVDVHVEPGMIKSDLMGQFIMRLKDLAEDYGMLIICGLHPPAHRQHMLARNKILTLADGADTAHWGNKADIGWTMWRDFDGPTFLNVDKVKDHQVMGRPTVATLHVVKGMDRLEVDEIGEPVWEMIKKGRKPDAA